mmetsp:Transcript_21868/g.52253  ORF Transcript_21868/g.52253 Transcript_21868/m.52253 type:complete len:212 (-) Transcript_21868:133-768(-)
MKFIHSAAQTSCKIAPEVLGREESANWFVGLFSVQPTDFGLLNSLATIKSILYCKVFFKKPIIRFFIHVGEKLVDHLRSFCIPVPVFPQTKCITKTLEKTSCALSSLYFNLGRVVSAVKAKTKFSTYKRKQELCILTSNIFWAGKLITAFQVRRTVRQGSAADQNAGGYSRHWDTSTLSDRRISVQMEFWLPIKLILKHKKQLISEIVGPF